LADGDTDVTAHPAQGRGARGVVADGGAGVDDDASGRVHDDWIEIELLEFRDGDRQQAHPAHKVGYPVNG
jgi:hypothetical protein